MRVIITNDDGIDAPGIEAMCAALTHLAPGARAVLSSINHGGNLGFDVHCSGTVAAAREAASHGVRGIACSHYVRRGMHMDYATEGLRSCGNYHQRELILGADVDVCMGGRISIVEVG